MTTLSFLALGRAEEDATHGAHRFPFASRPTPPRPRAPAGPPLVTNSLPPTPEKDKRGSISSVWMDLPPFIVLGPA